jgi:hypothetical protein
LFLKKLTPLLIFVLLCSGLVELSYRYYASGVAAFNPARFNSLNLLLLSGLVQRSQYPDIFYQLKPDLDTLFQGISFKTNSAGMADKEYSTAKPENTLRVAVVGSSWTMATAAAQDSVYHSLLESELSASNTSHDFEFLNFGVEYYGLRELVGTVRHRAVEWDPDILVVAITPFTAKIRWDVPSSDEKLPDQTNPFFQSYALRAFDKISGLGFYAKGLADRPVIQANYDDAYRAQLERAFHELHQIASEKNLPLMVMWLSYKNPSIEIEVFLHELSAKYDVIFVDTYNWLNNSDESLLYSGRFNKHPNRSGHKLIAQSLKKAMLDNQLIPGL